MLLRRGSFIAFQIFCVLCGCAVVKIASVQAIDIRQVDCSNSTVKADNCTQTDDNEDNSSPVLPTAAIIAIGAGGGLLVVSVVLCLCVCCCCFWFRRRRTTGSKDLPLMDTAEKGDGVGGTSPISVSSSNVFAQEITRVNTTEEPRLTPGSPDNDNPLYSFESSTVPRRAQSSEKVQESVLSDQEILAQPRERSQSYVQMTTAGTIRDNLGQVGTQSTMPHSKSTGDILGGSEIYTEVVEPNTASFIASCTSEATRPTAFPEPADLKQVLKKSVQPPSPRTPTRPRPPVPRKPTVIPPLPLHTHPNLSEQPVTVVVSGEGEEQDEGGRDDYVDPKVFREDYEKDLYVNRETIQDQQSYREDETDALLTPKGSRSPKASQSPRGSRSSSHKSQTKQPITTSPSLKGASLLAAIAAAQQDLEENTDFQTTDEFLGRENGGRNDQGGDKETDGYYNVRETRGSSDGPMDEYYNIREVRGSSDGPTDEYYNVRKVRGSSDGPAELYENIEGEGNYRLEDYQSMDEVKEQLLAEVGGREGWEYLPPKPESGKPRSETQTSDNQYVYMKRGHTVDVAALLRDGQETKSGGGYQNLNYDNEEGESEDAPLYENAEASKPRSKSGPAKVVGGLNGGREGEGGRSKRKVMEVLHFPTSGGTGGDTKRLDAGEELTTRDGHTGNGVTNGDSSPVDAEGVPLYVNVERTGVAEADDDY